ncbi:MAG: hypothetical protein JXL97_05460 [Bacteroidales bacterium]|nr:hypothetical protein [Bacteroidales bacterium]
MAKKERLKQNFKLITVGIFLFVLVIIILSIGHPKAADTDEAAAKCIGEKATLYVQLGCSHCTTQEKILGENAEHIEIVDCFYERTRCSDIYATPSWKINGEIFTGVKTFEQLRELTKC